MISVAEAFEILAEQGLDLGQVCFERTLAETPFGPPKRIIEEADQKSKGISVLQLMAERRS